METKTKIMWMKVFMIFYIFCGVVGFYAALKTENILVFVYFYSHNIDFVDTGVIFLQPELMLIHGL